MIENKDPFSSHSLSDIMVKVIKYIPQFSVGCNRSCFIGYVVE